jgi:hypothetical protein
MKGFDKIVRYIIEELRDETWRSEEVSLIYSAIKNGHNNTLDILINNNTKWNQDWKINDKSFLLTFVMNGNLEAVKTIVKKEMFSNDDLKEAQKIACDTKEKCISEDLEKWNNIIDIMGRKGEQTKPKSNKEIKQTKNENKKKTSSGKNLITNLKNQYKNKKSQQGDNHHLETNESLLVTSDQENYLEPQDFNFDELKTSVSE